MRLSEWAKAEGVHYQTARRWFRDGQLPVPAIRTPSGTILVEVPRSSTTGVGRTAVYARVSSHDQRGDLDRQVARLTEWATSQGMVVSEVVTEVGSGLNARRKKLARLLSDASVSIIVVEHRDRLARFGVEHLEAALSAQGRRILVVDEGEVEDDLVRDMTEVLSSFCARLYGRRGARNRAIKALNCAKNNVGPSALMLLSLSSCDEAPGLRGVFGMLGEPCHVSPGKCGVVLESAFEFGDPGGPAA